MAKRVISERHHLARCLLSEIHSDIFKVLLKENKPLRQKDFAQEISNKNKNVIGNYLRRLAKYNVFRKEKIQGVGTFYFFSDNALKEHAQRHFDFLIDK